MTNKRADSFRIAFDTLKAELRTGTHAAGARLTANEIGARLALSQTPVREALSRLAGEGLLIERRGQGFFVPKLTDQDLSLLFRLQRDLLAIALASDPAAQRDLDFSQLAPSELSSHSSDELVLLSERVFRALAVASSPALAVHLSRLQDQLAPVRRLEDRILRDTAEELVWLLTSAQAEDGMKLARVLDAYFERRIGAASLLARAYETSKNIESI